MPIPVASFIPAAMFAERMKESLEPEYDGKRFPGCGPVLQQPCFAPLPLLLLPMRETSAQR